MQLIYKLFQLYCSSILSATTQKDVNKPKWNNPLDLAFDINLYHN